jgi:hypothetical protein
MWTSDIEDDDFLQIRHLNDLSSVRSNKLTSAAGGFASGMGFKLIVAAIVVEGFCPRLIGRLRIG